MLQTADARVAIVTNGVDLSLYDKANLKILKSIRTFLNFKLYLPEGQKSAKKVDYLNALKIHFDSEVVRAQVLAIQAAGHDQPTLVPEGGERKEEDTSVDQEDAEEEMGNDHGNPEDAEEEKGNDDQGDATGEDDDQEEDILQVCMSCKRKIDHSEYYHRCKFFGTKNAEGYDCNFQCCEGCKKKHFRGHERSCRQ